MSTVMLLDDNRSKSAYLKMAIMRRGFTVRRHDQYRAAIGEATGRPPDLILVNHAFDSQKGWDTLQRLKQDLPGQPVLLYVLGQMATKDADWIVEAAVEGVKAAGRTRSVHGGVCSRRRRPIVTAPDRLVSE